MVGLKNPCNKCLVKVSCSDVCDDYLKFDKVFKLFFSKENLGVILTLLTVLPASILILTGFFKTAVVVLLISIYFIIGALLSVLAKSASKERSTDHLFSWYYYITLILVGFPVSVAILISNFLEKYNRCAAYYKK